MSCLTRSDGNGFEIEKCPAPCGDITQASSCQKSENAEYCDWKSDTETLPETSYSCNVHGIIPYRNLICIVQ